ncbi:MAG: hypothetical protein Q9217_000926 [Psora testacea]
MSASADLMAQAATVRRARSTVKSTPRSKKSSTSIEAKSPPSKRARLQTPERLPQTAGKGVLNETSAVNGTLQATDPLDRPAEPQRTNAPLMTPRGSCLVTYTNNTVNVSPSKTGLPRPTTTTGHILQDACDHLIKVEPRLKPLIEKHYCHIFCPEGLAEECDPFRSLCSSIMAQQVSGAAASSIKKKFVALFQNSPAQVQSTNDQTFPTPAQVAECTVPFLRQAGLSERKAEYIKGLAEKFASGQLSAAMLINASDEEVLDKLTAVRGLGRWSVEMFACFGLKRMDVLSTGDLGVQRGMAAFMGKDVNKLKAKGGGKWKYMSEQDMLKHSEKFAPYR